MKHSFTYLQRILLALSFWLGLFQTGQAQDFILSRIDTSNFPRIRADYTATDAAGNPRGDLTNTDFNVIENGINIPASLVTNTCDAVSKDPDVSVLLVMDVSNSMNPLNNGGEDRMEWMQYGGKTFIQNLSFTPKTTVGLTAFSTYTYLKVDFTQNKQLLIDSINALKAGGATYYNPAFLWPTTGVINLFKSRDPRVRKIVIFMTDGDPTDGDQLEQQKIIDSLKYYNIQAFSIGLGNSVSSAFLPAIARETGGKYYTAKTRGELADIYKLLAIESQTKQECHREWKSKYSCSDLERVRNVKIT